MLNFRPILYVIGVLLSILSILMVIPALVDLRLNNDSWVSFLISAFLTAFIGVSLIFTNQVNITMATKQIFILTSLGLFSVAIFGALPFAFAHPELGFIDAFFESMSGLTTTGATIFRSLDTMPAGILLWRSMLQFIGGLTMIIIAISILPVLQIGGMQIFRTEGSDASDKVMPRIVQMSIAIGSVYLLLNVICAVFLWAAGMNEFDAINHAMATVSTGGFSTHDKSLGYYNSATIDYVTTFFMIMSALPFVLYVKMLRGNFSSLWKDSQVKWFITIVAICVLFRVFWLVFLDNISFFTALRHASFNIISIISTTGFATYPTSFPLTIIFLLSVIGGCAGSTAGGVKIFRYFVLYHTGRAQITNLTQPHTIIRPRFNGTPISESTASSVLNFFILFSFCFMVLALFLSLCGLGFDVSMSAAAGALSNVGPGILGSFNNPSDYATIPDAAKAALAFGMFIGRLEIFTVVVLFSSYFWKD